MSSSATSASVGASAQSQPQARVAPAVTRNDSKPLSNRSAKLNLLPKIPTAVKAGNKSSENAPAASSIKPVTDAPSSALAIQPMATATSQRMMAAAAAPASTSSNSGTTSITTPTASVSIDPTVIIQQLTTRIQMSEEVLLKEIRELRRELQEMRQEMKTEKGTKKKDIKEDVIPTPVATHSPAPSLSTPSVTPIPMTTSTSTTPGPSIESANALTTTVSSLPTFTLASTRQSLDIPNLGSYIGELNRNNQPHGVGQLIYQENHPSLLKSFDGQWSDGQRVNGKLVWVNGNDWVGDFIRDICHIGTLHLSANDLRIEGEWISSSVEGGGGTTKELKGLIYGIKYLSNDKFNPYRPIGASVGKFQIGHFATTDGSYKLFVKDIHRSRLPWPQTSVQERLTICKNEAPRFDLAELIFDLGNWNFWTGYYIGSVNDQLEAHGEGYAYNEKNIEIASPHWLNSKLHGQGFKMFRDVVRYEGKFNEGRPTTGVLTFPDTDEIKTVTGAVWNKDDPNQVESGHITYLDGSTYSGKIHTEVFASSADTWLTPRGPGTKIFSDGRKVEGSFYMDQVTGLTFTSSGDIVGVGVINSVGELTKECVVTRDRLPWPISSASIVATQRAKGELSFKLANIIFPDLTYFIGECRGDEFGQMTRPFNGEQFNIHNQLIGTYASGTKTVITPPPLVTPIVPHISTLPPGEYDVFLSHRQRDTQDFVSQLCQEFDRRGYRAFLDRNDANDLNDLMTNVRHSKTLIFILSNTIFESEWCLKELNEAITNNIPVVLVRYEDASWSGAKFPPDALIPPHLKSAFTHKAVEHTREYFTTFMEKLCTRVGPPAG